MNENTVKNTNHEISQYLAEFIGTFFLVFFGCGAVITSQLRPDIFNPVFIPIVFGAVVSAMIYAVGHISGAHFNPAVTISFFILKRFPTKRLPGYIMAQVLGALLASSIHLLIWTSLGHGFGVTSVSGTLMSACILEFILSFVLMFVITSVATDSRAVGELAGLAIGLTVMICAFVGGPFTGASMNPARSIGPAVISGNTLNLSLYIIVPIIGAALGALAYEWIRCHKETDGEHGCC